ncbi:MAG: sensor histidine kinase [Parvularculaceae bacterium]
MRSIGSAFFGDFSRDQVNWARASFADRTLERQYQQHLVDVELPKERLVNYLGLLTYISFGILDIMTFDQRLSDVLWVRWGLCTPFAAFLIALTHFRPVKPYFQWLTASVMLIGSLSMVWMIAILPLQGGPPYIIGILVIFIFYSCIQRIHFLVAAGVFLIVSVVYSVTITYISTKTSIEIASGHFFIIFTTFVALATSYSQEIRSRLVFYRNYQRELDSAFIEKLLIEATASDQAKINFLSILSHELRTPLHQIIGFSEVVKTHFQNKQGGDDEVGSFLEQIHSSAAGLLAMIGKMLRYADATAGKIKYDPSDCDMHDIVDTIVAHATEKAKEKNVTIESSEIEPIALKLDHNHTTYAFGHVLDNAIAASPEGARVILRGVRLNPDEYVLEISDRGAGMTAAQIEAAFKPFSQVEDARTRSVEGVGLGLTLSKKILDDQGATLEVHSAPGAGTTVKARFPIPAAPLARGGDAA